MNLSPPSQEVASAMQDVVVLEPYKFIPPVATKFWPAILKHFAMPILRRSYGVCSMEFRGLDLYRKSLEAGHGILLAANHSRPADPIAVGALVKECGQPFYMMASWHLFKQGRLQAWFIRHGGAFSVFREGVDRQALTKAVNVLVEADRPLLLFPEGAVSRTNDLLNNLLEGISFIARTAAKKRAKAKKGRVVIQPLVLKYVFQGDLEASVRPVLADIEGRLSWQPQRDLSLLERVFKLGHAVLTLKELEYLGEPNTGSLGDRVNHLREAILAPIEMEWGSGDEDAGIVERVKRLRSVILPDMVANKVVAEERRRRWRQLADVTLAQQLSLYPPEYVRSNPTPERILETVERIDEDLHDEARIHSPLHVILQFGEAIEVDAQRVRRDEDPLLGELRTRMQTILGELQKESGEPLPLPESLKTSGF